MKFVQYMDDLGDLLAVQKLGQKGNPTHAQPYKGREGITLKTSWSIEGMLE